MQEYKMIGQCPVCGSELNITKLACKHCGTEITGQFTPCKFCTWSPANLYFLETFIRCRGNIKEMEKVLGISYPTVRNRLEALITLLGTLEEQTEIISENTRFTILELLEKGKINPDKAIRLLSGEEDLAEPLKELLPKIDNQINDFKQQLEDLEDM